MVVALLGVGSFLVAAAMAIVIRGGRRRQLTLALVGVAFWAAIGAWAVSAGCDEGDECWLGLVFFGTLAALWLAGVGAAALVRSDVGEPGWRTTAAGCSLLLVVLAAFVFSVYGYEIVRLGCPTNAELQRVQSVDEVVEAFEDGDLPLERTSMPAAIPPTAPGPRGGTAFRHVASGATLYVVVCPRRCVSNRFRHDREDTTGQRWRLGMNSGNNVPVWVTETERRAGTRLLAAVERPLREVHPYVEYGSRCYIG
jgi:hypothetical protein